jgi:hypothetical protein
LRKIPSASIIPNVTPKALSKSAKKIPSYVERRISLVNTILPGGMSCVFSYGAQFCRGSDFLKTIVVWIQKARDLFTLGMPEGHFKLVVDGNANESVQCWKLLKQVAILQDAMMYWGRIHNIQPHDIPNDGLYSWGWYNLPWLLPSDFSKVVRDRIKGT